MDPNTNQPLVICELCGTYFETRRGLSSHARLHLRQLGVPLSETSGAPIDLLYQFIKERDGTFPKFKKDSTTPVSTPPKKPPQQEPSTPPVLKDKGASSKVGSKAMATAQKKSSQGTPTAMKESVGALLTSSPSPLRADSKPPGNRTSASSGPSKSSSKPLWAPQETDAPLTLAANSNDEVHVCQLCGAWYETRKGLSSHARAHLRQFGVAENTESKGGPIELLYQIMAAEDVKAVGSKQQSPLKASTSSKSSNKHPPALSSPPMSASTSMSASPEPLQSPPAKKAKPSSEFTCVLCGEEFENRKGLASHARSHLRQIGVSELVGKSSAINTVEKLVKTGVLAGVEALKTKYYATSSSPAPGQDPVPSPAPSASSSRSTHSPHPPSSGAPKAKKGFRLAVDPLKRKPKPEFIEVDVSKPLQGNNSTSIALSSGWLKPNITSTPTAESFSAGSYPDMESIPLVPCHYCSQLFDSRKALSCHARAHLRQLGIPWSINESPITVLKEYMELEEKVKNENISSGGSASGKNALRQMCPPQGPRRSLDSLSVGSPSKPNTPPLNFSLKDKTSPSKNGTLQADTSCELCGFDFDNRKALASHARAHLRQLGVTEWKADGVKGSPIKLLSQWIQREPGKVAEITQRYRMGSLYIRKTQKSDPSPSTSMDSDSGTLKPPGQHPEHRLDADVFELLGGSSKTAQARSLTEKSDTERHSARGELSLCFPKGFRSPKRPAPAEVENQDSNSQQPSRSGNIPALLPEPPLDPLVKLVGKVYSLKCRFCEEVFHGPVSIQEDWIRHLQEHILKLGYRGKASPPATPVTAPALLGPVAV